MLKYVAAILLIAATPAFACTVVPRATIALGAGPAGWTVPLDIDGTTVPFLLDTGAERSVVFEETADRLKLARDEWVATIVRGVGGAVRRRNALPRSLTLAGVVLRRATMAGDNSLTVAPVALPGIGGLLGQDLLSRFDLDLAMNTDHPTLGLNEVANCTGRFLPWHGAYDAIPAWRAVRNILLLPLQVDGQTLHGMIDTGAGSSLLTIGGAARLGLMPSALNADPTAAVRGLGDETIPIRRHRFASVTIGGDVRRDVDIEVGPIRLIRSIDLILGRDWFRRERLWISFATNTVFVASALADRP